MNSTKTNKIIGLLIVAISLAFPFFVFEIFLRWDNAYDPYPATIESIEGKDYRFLWSSHPDSVNNPIEKPRLFVIGDSFVAGVTCAKSSTNLTGHMQHLLGSNYEVINLGMGGLGPSDYIDFLNHFKIRKNDHVIEVLYDNDIHMGKNTCQDTIRQAQKLPLYTPTFCENISSDEIEPKDKATFLLKINSALNQFKVWEFIKESSYNIPVVSSLFYRSDFQSRWSKFELEENKWLSSTLPVMKSLVENRGAKLYITYFPNTNYITLDDPRHREWLKFIDHIKSIDNIKIYDPYPYFIGTATKKSMVWSLTDKHPSCDGYKMMAEYLVKSVINIAK